MTSVREKHPEIRRSPVSSDCPHIAFSVPIFESSLAVMELDQDIDFLIDFSPQLDLTPFICCPGNQSRFTALSSWEKVGPPYVLLQKIPVWKAKKIEIPNALALQWSM